MPSYPDVVADLESPVRPDQALEDLGQAAVLANVILAMIQQFLFFLNKTLVNFTKNIASLQSRDAVVSDDEPQLQRAEAARQRDSPVLLKKKI